MTLHHLQLMRRGDIELTLVIVEVARVGLASIAERILWKLIFHFLSLIFGVVVLLLKCENGGVANGETSALFVMSRIVGVVHAHLVNFAREWHRIVNLVYVWQLNRIFHFIARLFNICFLILLLLLFSLLDLALARGRVSITAVVFFVHFVSKLLIFLGRHFIKLTPFVMFCFLELRRTVGTLTHFQILLFYYMHFSHVFCKFVNFTRLVRNPARTSIILFSLITIR